MNKKLKELILHIAKICKDDPEFGATKLNKILFVSDFYAYSVFGKSITGAKYFHLPKGPAPKEMKAVQEELKAKKEVEIKEKPYFGRTQKRLFPKRKANVSMFTDSELELVKDIIKSMQGFNAKQLSDWTHRLLPWLLTEEKEEIPYCTTFTMFKVPVSRGGILWGEKELNRLKDLGYVS